MGFKFKKRSLYVFGLVATLLSMSTSCRTTHSASDTKSDLASVPVDPVYDAKSAQEKQDILWQKIVASRYTTLPQFSGLEPLPVLANSLNKNTKPFYQVTMQRLSDEMPENRTKRIHTYGSVAKIKFVPFYTSTYTGLFKGVQHGLIRTSLATKASETNSVPGLAVKFLIDGQPSRNFMAMYSLDGQPNSNFFSNDFSNEVAEPVGGPVKILAGVFSRVSNHPNRVDVSYLGNILENGTPVANPIAPLRVKLVPNRAVLDRWTYSNGALHDVREDFARIPAGTVLYQVLGFVDPTKPTGLMNIIGSIVTDSEFIASAYGDKNLFFRHQIYTGDVEPSK